MNPTRTAHIKQTPWTTHQYIVYLHETINPGQKIEIGRNLCRTKEIAQKIAEAWATNPNYITNEHPDRAGLITSGTAQS